MAGSFCRTRLYRPAVSLVWSGEIASSFLLLNLRGCRHLNWDMLDVNKPGLSALHGINSGTIGVLYSTIRAQGCSQTNSAGAAKRPGVVRQEPLQDGKRCRLLCAR